jgi:hypothetical protein
VTESTKSRGDWIGKSRGAGRYERKDGLGSALMGTIPTKLSSTHLGLIANYPRREQQSCLRWHVMLGFVTTLWEGTMGSTSTPAVSNAALFGDQLRHPI